MRTLICFILLFTISCTKNDSSQKTETTDSATPTTQGPSKKKLSPSTMALVNAMIDKDLQAAKQAMANDADYNAVLATKDAANPANGMTPFQIALKQKFKQGVDLLMEKTDLTANPIQLPQKEEPSLALRFDDDSIFLSLIERGIIKPGYKTAAGNGLITLLMFEHPDKLEKHIGYLKSRGFDVDQKGNLGGTALMWAVATGNTEAMKVLLAHGADKEATDKQGQKAIDYIDKGKPKDAENWENPKKDEIIEILKG